jgi:hypothetical protein
MRSLAVLLILSVAKLMSTLSAVCEYRVDKIVKKSIDINVSLFLKLGMNFDLFISDRPESICAKINKTTFK